MNRHDPDTPFESFRASTARWVESRPVQRAIIALILLNAVILGMETSSWLMERLGRLLVGADRVILSIFVVEILVKLYAQRQAFFRNPWNLFDFTVVTIALVPASGPLAVLRVLRLLRLVSLVPKLRFVVEALLHAIPGILSILGLLLLIFYVFAVIATGLFGSSFPDWFGSLGRAMYTLFQIMTLESWSMGIVRPVMESYPWAWVFFVMFILVATFTMLNLFIAIIVNTMQTLQEGRQGEERHALEEVVHGENLELHRDLAHMQNRMQDEYRRMHADLHALHGEIAALRKALAAREEPPR